MSDGRWLDEREQAAWRSVVRGHSHLIAELSRRLATESRLSYQDYEVLVALTDQPDGRVRSFRLAEELAWEKSRLSHHVTRMAARGLVAKEPCGEDRRGSFVAITDEGRTAIAAAAPGHVAAVRELFIDRLNRTQLQTVARVADIVLDGLDVGSKSDRKVAERS